MLVSQKIECVGGPSQGEGAAYPLPLRQLKAQSVLQRFKMNQISQICSSNRPPRVGKGWIWQKFSRLQRILTGISALLSLCEHCVASEETESFHSGRAEASQTGIEQKSACGFSITSLAGLPGGACC